MGCGESGRGCPFTCEFCAITAAHKAQYKSKEIQHIISDIENISQKMLYFATIILFQNSQNKELCDAMIPLKKKWFSHGTINMAVNQTY